MSRLKNRQHRLRLGNTNTHRTLSAPNTSPSSAPPRPAESKQEHCVRMDLHSNPSLPSSFCLLLPIHTANCLVCRLSETCESCESCVDRWPVSYGQSHTEDSTIFRVYAAGAPEPASLYDNADNASQYLSSLVYLRLPDCSGLSLRLRYSASSCHILKTGDFQLSAGRLYRSHLIGCYKTHNQKEGRYVRSLPGP